VDGIHSIRAALRINSAPPLLAKAAVQLPGSRKNRAMTLREFRKTLSRTVQSAWLLRCLVLSFAAFTTAPAAAPGQTKESPKSAATKPAPDPCGLLSSSEIKTVQGETVVEKKYSEQGTGSFLLRACFYLTPTFTKSVSLALAVPNPASAAGDGPRDYWLKQFHDADTSPDGRLTHERRLQTKEEQAEQKTKPVEVSGLGEQAYWIPDPHVGTLYVLEENYFLRISLGGKDSNDVRSKKANDLARAALRRLKPARAAATLTSPLAPWIAQHARNAGRQPFAGRFSALFS